MQKYLIRLIEIAGAALEAEDRYLLGGVTANKTAYPNESGGILRIKNERYYQFVTARALVSSFPYPVELEVDYHDLVIKYPNSKNWFAVVEMKRWMSSDGLQEIPGILQDINKLKASNADHALMLIFSGNPKGMTKKNVDDLATKLGISPSMSRSYSFPTLGKDGTEVEFWVAGYQVKPVPTLRVGIQKKTLQRLHNLNKTLWAEVVTPLPSQISHTS